MLVWMLLWVSGVLGQTDMKETLFDFPKELSTSRFRLVRLYPELSGPFEEATVCMRFHSDLTRSYSLFSLFTQRKSNNFLLHYYPGANTLQLAVSNTTYKLYDLQGNNFTEWTSICVTWNSTVWAVWIDGKKYNKDGIGNVKISADPKIIIGLEQRSCGGRFDACRSFVGEITDINMWDKALTDDNVIDYLADNGISGNVINWNALRYKLYGDVFIRHYVDPYPCEPV